MYKPCYTYSKIYRLLIGLIILFISSLSFADNIGFNKMAEKLLQDRLGNNDIELDIIFSSKTKYQEILRKQNDISKINVANLNGAAFKLSINYHNYPSQEIIGRFNGFLQIPILTKYTKSGTKISDSDIALQRVALHQVPRDCITSKRGMVGMQVKRNIQPNILLKSVDIIKPQIINKNDVVHVKYQTNKINLKATAVALNSGALSDRIKLKNEKSGIIISGQIIDDKTVKVIS